MANPADELLIASAAVGRAARSDVETPWERPTVIVTVTVAASAIIGSGLYLILAETGGLAAVAAFPAFVAVLASGLVGLGYALFLAWKVKRSRLLADIFEKAEAPRAILDGKFAPVAVNGAFRKLFGGGLVDPLTALGERAADTGPAREAMTQLRAAAETGRSAAVELPLSDSSTVYRLMIEPLGPRSNATLLRLRDVTADRAKERTLREEYARCMAFIEDAPVGIYAVDEGGFFRFINRTMAGWLGADPRNLTAGGARLHDFVADRLPGGTAAHDPFGNGSEAGVAHLYGRQGRHFRAAITRGRVSPIASKDSSSWAVVSDLSSAQGRLDGIKASARQLERMFANSPIGVAVLDLEGNILESNTVFCEIAGVKHADVGMRPLADLFAEDERPDVFDRIARISAGDDNREAFEAQPATRPGSVASMFLSRLTDPGGETSGLIVQLLEATEQRNLEVQFAQSQKMQAVGQLAGGIAHDFNNLLTAMIGFCDLLLLRHKPGEESFADVMQIKQNANRAANLVRQLLAFSRQQTLEPKVLNITDVLAELTHLLRRLIGENIELDVVHGRDLGMVRVDQGQLEQVIINLVVNARDAMPTGGMLTVRTGNVSSNDPIRRDHELMPPGNYVLTEVIDTGEGIPKENLGRIFEPFYSTKEVGSGTGLGLSTVYGIVKQTGGFIFVDSEPGKGAKFSIFLPRHDHADRPAGPQPVPETEDRRDLTGVGTVLLVEDEDAVRLFGSRALRNKGYIVKEAPSGEEALTIIQQEGEDIDLLITDVVMPNMDGPTLIRHVREIRPEMKIICISGYAEDAFRSRIDRGTDIHFLPKPFSLQQLAGKVKDVMQGPPA